TDASFARAATTLNTDQEGSERSSAPCQFPSREGLGVGSRSSGVPTDRFNVPMRGQKVAQAFHDLKLGDAQCVVPTLPEPMPRRLQQSGQHRLSRHSSSDAKQDTCPKTCPGINSFKLCIRKTEFSTESKRIGCSPETIL